MKENPQMKFNDVEMAKHAKCFNQLCAKNNIASFWWDTNFLIRREEKQTFQKVIDAIMAPYADKKFIKNSGSGFEAAENAVNNMKTGWNLGNTLDAHKSFCVFNNEKNLWEETVNLTGLETENCWFMPTTTPQMIQYVKELGFNAVRIPVTWAGHLDQNNNIAPEWMARVKEIADYVISQDMYCIINVHHDSGGHGWVRACESSYLQYSDRLTSIYKQLAQTFADYDEKLLLAGINEILDENASWADPSPQASFWCDKWNQLFVDTVRSSGGKNKERNLIVMGPAGKSSKIAMQQFNMPSDSVENHLIFEFHNYDPQSFCWPQNKDGSNKGETPYWDQEKNPKILEEVFENLMSFSGKLKAPIICGEYAAWPKVLPE
ncbi:MAG: glycoside hydrolase family 5 protein [Treponema sp.]|nr:glycoside hydrolase family 5 protein [Treponema sp.]